MSLAVFPDLKSTTDLLVVRGDLVTGHITTDGTHTSDYMEVLATDRRVSFSEVLTARLTNGKASNHREVAETMAMLQQTDVISAE